MSYSPRPPLGQATMANSEPVVLASDQSDVKVTLDGETVAIASSALPTGASTLAEQQTQTTHLATIAGDTTDIETAIELIDDTVVTLGTDTYTEATSKGLVIGAVRRDADTTLVNTTNEFAPLQLDVNGRLKVEAFSGETLPVSLTSTTITGSVAVTNAGTFPVQIDGAALTALQLIDDTVFVDNSGFTDNSSKVTVAGFYFDDVAGTALTENDVAAARIDSKRAVVNVIEDATTRGQKMTVTSRGSILNEGDVAHDTGNAGNPMQMGGHAVSGSASPTSVAAADRVRAIFNQHGIQYTMNGHPNLITREYDFGTAAQTDVNLAAAVVAADERIYVTRFEATCDMANTVNVTVRAGFGTANVPTASATGVSGMIGSHPGLAPGSGIVSGNGAGIIAVGGAGEEPRITTSAATSGNLHVIISYYLIDETP